MKTIDVTPMTDALEGIAKNNKKHVDLLEKIGLEMSEAMGKAMDKSLFFPIFDYEKKHLSKWDKFKLWKEEMSHRINTAIEVLKGQHYCEE